MRLLDFLRKESTASLHKLIFMAGLAGLSNTSVLAIINSASEQIAKHNQNTRYLLLFAISITLYIIAQRYVMEVSTKEVESIIDRFRVRFATLLGNCDLQQLERLGRSEIYASITTETLTISQSIPGILVGVQSAILMFFTSIYVAWLSLPTFFICVVFVAIALSIHFERAREVTQQHHPVHHSELRRRLAEATPVESRQLPVEYLRAEVAQVLGFPASRRIEPQQGFFDMGMDSLMAVTLKNRLEVALDQWLPPTLTFDSATVESLAAHLLEMIAPSRLGPTSTTDNAGSDKAIDEISHMPEEELESFVNLELQGSLR